MNFIGTTIPDRQVCLYSPLHTFEVRINKRHRQTEILLGNLYLLHCQQSNISLIKEKTLPHQLGNKSLNIAHIQKKNQFLSYISIYAGLDRDSKEILYLLLTIQRKRKKNQNGISTNISILDRICQHCMTLHHYWTPHISILTSL